MRQTRYFGKICAKHPKLRGERLKSNSHCIVCHRITIRLAKVRQQWAKQKRIKEEVMAHYDKVCKRCGERDPDVLTIDHEKQDGAAHRRAMNINSGQQFYRWLKHNGFPAGFKTLCFNCNIKRYKQHLRGKR